MMFSSDRCKGSEDALKAIDAAKKAHPDLRAVLFGIPPRTAEIPRWMEYHQNPPQERLVRDIYNSSSAFLCGSWSEGFALPPLEAMACGCAVVSTDCGGNRDYAEHEKTALLSPPRNPELLAQNLLRLLDDDALRLRLAKAGVERVRDFTWEDRAAQLEAFIQERVAAPVVPR
jgi:glycosyltransferase involved in cell wall biosynthesis